MEEENSGGSNPRSNPPGGALTCACGAIRVQDGWPDGRLLLQGIPHHPDSCGWMGVYSVAEDLRAARAEVAKLKRVIGMLLSHVETAFGVRLHTLVESASGEPPEAPKESP